MPGLVERLPRRIVEVFGHAAPCHLGSYWGAVSGQHEADGGAESTDDLLREETCGRIGRCIRQCIQSKTGGAYPPDAAALVVVQAEGGLLWKNGIEHLQDLALGKLCAEGIVHPGGLRERGIEKGTHVPYAWAVSGVVDDGVGKEDECWVV